MRPRRCSSAWRVGCALTLGLLLSACQAGGGAQDNAEWLIGAWQIETVGGQPVQADSQANVVFRANELSGNASCNRFFGTYQYSDGLFRTSELAGTKMMCSPSVMAQEDKVFVLLGQASQVRMHNNMLHLLDDYGAVLISARRVEPDE